MYVEVSTDGIWYGRGSRQGESMRDCSAGDLFWGLLCDVERLEIFSL